MSVNVIYHSDWNESGIYQVTDLKDKNGKGIHEGDIVLTWRHECGQMWPANKGIVQYQSESMSFILWNAILKHDILKEEIKTDFSLEVLGNIYENPELMNP